MPYSIPQFYTHLSVVIVFLIISLQVASFFFSSANLCLLSATKCSFSGSSTKRPLHHLGYSLLHHQPHRTFPPPAPPRLPRTSSSIIPFHLQFSSFRSVHFSCAYSHQLAQQVEHPLHRNQMGNCK